ncbi:hypothetical protein TSAR_016259 [Trichomalopsis sarcophagae]|uniref:Uncharacterized protein n=1 Tax=Trichomalopsis sarcophagae TaxID=543379 RepID=A0A232EIT5_9HYME|nr:hypothetical protein TSAR_016259 [Trichomalopsis sarcophagae]
MQQDHRPVTTDICNVNDNSMSMVRDYPSAAHRNDRVAAVNRNTDGNNSDTNQESNAIYPPAANEQANRNEPLSIPSNNHNRILRQTNNRNVNRRNRVPYQNTITRINNKDFKTKGDASKLIIACCEYYIGENSP